MHSTFVFDGDTKLGASAVCGKYAEAPEGYGQI